MLDFRVLGPVDVLDPAAPGGPRPLPIKGGHDSHLLGRLVIAANRPLPRATLIEALWVDPPSSARRVVENAVSRLRAALGDTSHDLIRYAGTCYELRLDQHRSDLEVFRDHASAAASHAVEGAFDRANEAAEAGLALWRGPALAGVDESLVAGVRVSLRRERDDLSRIRAEALVELGHDEKALRALLPLLGRDPLDDHLQALRMRSLSRLGRRADALAVFPEVHRLHRDTDGLDPSRELIDLQQALLRGEEASPPRARTIGHVPRQLPALTMAPVGRDDLVADIVTALTPATGRATPATALLTGPGGVGKTTAAVAAGHLLADRFPDGQVVCDLRGLYEDAPDVQQVLGRILRAIGTDPDQIPVDPADRIALYRTRLADARLLIVLDDAGSLQQVLPLVPPSPRSAVLVTSRHRLGWPGARQWTVPTLPTSDAVTLLTRAVGDDRLAANRLATEEIAAACGALPLALALAGARLASHPEWEPEDLALRLREQHRRLDELHAADVGVRSSIASSVDALDETARHLLLRLGALGFGPDVPGWVAPVLLDTEPTAGRAAMDALVDLHLVQAGGRDPLRQERFSLHDLVADYAREHAEADPETATETTAAVERVLHAWLGLLTVAAECLGEEVDPADAATPIPGAVAAVHDDTRRWFTVEVDCVTAAIDTACRTRHGDLAARMVLLSWNLLELDNRLEHLIRLLTSVLRAVTDPVLTLKVIGQLISAHTTASNYGSVPPLARRQWEGARHEGVAARLRALTQLAYSDAMVGDLNAASAAIEQAVAIDREAEPGAVAPALRSRLLTYRGRVLLEAGAPAEAIEPLAAGADALRDLPGQRVYWRLGPLADAQVDLGLTSKARATLDEIDRMAEEFGDDNFELTTLTRRVDVALADLDVDEATALLDRGRELLPKLYDREDHALLCRQEGDLALVRGDPRAALVPLEQAVHLMRRIGRELEAARALVRLARAHQQLGDTVAADRDTAAADEVLRRFGLDEAALRLPRYLPGPEAGPEEASTT